MYPQENTAPELFSADVGPFWQWPGLMRCIVGFAGVTIGLLGMAFGLQQAIVVDGQVASFSPWFLVVLFGGLFGIKLFAYTCLFPDENRTLGAVASNAVWLVLLLLLVAAIAFVFFVLQHAMPARSSGSNLERIAALYMLINGVLAWVVQVRLWFGKNLTSGQAAMFRRVLTKCTEGFILGFAILMLLRLVF